MSKVTIVLPVYNGERYLRETLESILAQSYDDFELLVIDDGSTDSSPEIIKSFHDPRIRVLKNPTRLKLSGALNRGLEEARSPYLARMDADDIALPNRLEVQVELMDQHPDVGIIGSGIEVFGSNITTHVDTYPKTSSQIRAYGLFDSPFCHPSVMLRKSLFDHHNLRYDGSYYPTEDYELWSRAFMLFPCMNTPEVLLRYRVHGASMTGADWGDMDKQATRIIGNLFEREGFLCTDQELQLHRNIGRGRSCRLANGDDLAPAESWLLKLLKNTELAKKYPARELAAATALVWYRLCMNNTLLGMVVVRRYIASSLSRKDPLRWQHTAMLCGSVLKNKVVPSIPV